MKCDLLSFNLMKAQRTLNRWLNLSILENGINAQQFFFLLILSESPIGECPLMELSKELCLDRTTISRNLKSMSNLAGIVGKDSHNGDKRKRVVKITEAGLVVLRMTTNKMMALDKQITKETEIAAGIKTKSLSNALKFLSTNYRIAGKTITKRDPKVPLLCT